VASPLHPGMVLTKPLPAQLQRRILISSRPLDAPAHAHGLDHAYLMPARHESPSGSLTRQEALLTPFSLRNSSFSADCWSNCVAATPVRLIFSLIVEAMGGEELWTVTIC